MFNVRSILHATDLWDTSSRAMEVAAGLATALRAKLVLLYVWQEPLIINAGAEPIAGIDTDALRDEAWKKFEQLTPPAAAGLTIERRFVKGEAADEIVRAATEAGCDMIVLGTHGRRGVERWLLGSVAEQVVRRAKCPVVTVKPTVEA